MTFPHWQQPYTVTLWNLQVIHRSCKCEIPGTGLGVQALSQPTGRAAEPGLAAPCFSVSEAADDRFQGSGPPWACDELRVGQILKVLWIPWGIALGELSALLSLARGTEFRPYFDF